MSTLNFIFYHLFLYLSINPFIYEMNQLKKIFEDLQKTRHRQKSQRRHTPHQKAKAATTKYTIGEGQIGLGFEFLRISATF